MDPDGRWRSVLDDWSDNGAALPPPVTVEDALTLLGDTSRSATATITLTAVALDEGYGESLTQLPCVVTSDGTHIAPPGTGSLRGLMTVPSPLAEALSVGIRLASDHLAEKPHSQSVLTWLRGLGATIDHGSDDEVLHRLAAAGKAGNCLDIPLGDDQLVALREAFELLPRPQRSQLGREVGQAILIAAYRYDSQGRVIETTARPGELYLSGAIERDSESFATAAAKTPDLLWTADRYANQLRSARGRTDGVGAQKFLTLLGVERAPRLIAHPGLETRYANKPKGLTEYAVGSPPERSQRFRELGATYSLDDIDSPDLRAVANEIAKDRRASSRRQRANALLGALGKAWDRLEDDAEVDAVQDDRTWHHRDRIRAFWLWSAGAIRWLDDTTGTPQAPLNLRLKTDATVAVHGSEAAGYLRPEFYTPSRSGILSALGVVGEPSTRDLIERLREVRDTSPALENIATEAALVYQALADRLASRTSVPGDLSERELRAAFGEGQGLVHTEWGWRSPAQVLSGVPVFGRYHAFVPSISRADRLWRALQIRKPSIDDCLSVIRQVAKNATTAQDDSADRLIILETLRVLTAHLEEEPELTRATKRTLSKLPILSNRGWTKSRPVYTSDDPALLEGLSNKVAVWDPGGDVSQFTTLLAPLGIARIDAGATIVDPGAATIDDDCTELFGRAVSLLREDLALNDPNAAGALTIGWDQLQGFEVRIDPNLRVRIELDAGQPPVEATVAARIDTDLCALFLTNGELLRKVDVGGSAVASLFSTSSPRSLAHAWLVACVAAEEGRTAHRLELAEQRASAQRARFDTEAAERTAAISEELSSRTAQKGRRRSGQVAEKSADNASSTADTPKPARGSKARVLVDPRKLVVTKIDGKPATGSKSRGMQRGRTDGSPQTGEGSRLASVNRDAAAPPQNVTPPPSFTSIDKESVGMAVLRRLWDSDTNEIVDIRSQQRVGADAIDNLERYVELKAHLGDEPDSIRLQKSQIERALTTPGYFLAVVSNLEGAEARPKVRIIVDPVHQLTTAESSSIIFTGVRSAKHSVVCYLEPETDDD